jgi:hypothetical protein
VNFRLLEKSFFFQKIMGQKVNPIIFRLGILKNEWRESIKAILIANIHDKQND